MGMVIFGGTTEGRELARLLADRGAEVVVSVATEYGREAQGVYPGVEVVCGRRDRKACAALLAGAALCVDATHPYAAEATETIRAACADTGVPYRRLLREAGETAAHTEQSAVHADKTTDGDNTANRDSTAGCAVYVDSAAAAAAYLRDRPGNILLANGSRELDRFASLDLSRLFPRILPAHESLSACERLGIPHRNIIAMQGPFSRELNEALLRQYGIAYLVTKDGGAAGGFPEKAAAARNTGAVLVVIRRPAEIGQNFTAIVEECTRLLGLDTRDRRGVSEQGRQGVSGQDTGNRRPSCW